MHLAFTVSCNNEHSIAPGRGCVSLSADAAKTILELHRAAMAFRKETSATGAVSEFYQVSVGLGDKLPCFKVVALAEPEFVHEELVWMLPADFNLDALPDSAFHRVECHRISLDTDSVRFTALDKHSGDVFSAADIALSVVRAIAEGKEPSLLEFAPAVAE